MNSSTTETPELTPSVNYSCGTGSASNPQPSTPVASKGSPSPSIRLEKLSSSQLPSIDPATIIVDLKGEADELPGQTDTADSLGLMRERMFLTTLCWNMFLTGWNSATLGPLLPTVQNHYEIGYTLVSMLFVSQCCGTIPGSAMSGNLTDKLGFGKLLALGASMQLVTYAVLAAAPPFPVFCVIYMLNGMAGAFQVASCNIFIASLPRRGPSNLGILHASFGTGALISPLVATQFAQQRHWSFHYLTSLSFAILNNVLVVLVFRWKRQEDFVPELALRRAENSAGTVIPEGKVSRTLRLGTVYFMALFIFVYVGAEITTGGWIFTYLLRYRHGGPSAGYVSSGFFGGLTLGRVMLLKLNRKIGAERVVFFYVTIAMGLEFTIWFVPSLVENAVAVSIVGVVLGPMYPILIQVASQKLPKELLAISISFISASGQTGSAIFPFVTGALASKYGVAVLQPVTVAMMASLLFLWLLVTRSNVLKVLS